MVELRDLQSGFAGITGTVWQIAPDGTYVVARVVNDTVSPPHMAGHLTEAQAAALAEALARYNANDLPPDLGADVKVNPHHVVLTVDGRTSKLTLPPGYALPTPVAGSAPDRLLAIAAAIKDAIGPPPQ